MGEFEDKLNKLLSSPDEMGKIMELARSFSGGQGDEEAGKHSPAQALPGMGELDPRLMKIMSRLMTEYSSKKDDKTAIISAMKPYLRKERHEKVDRAVEMARMAQLARIALTEFSGGDRNV